MKHSALYCNYRIRPYYRPCPHNGPSLTFYFIFTYYRPLDDLLTLVNMKHMKHNAR